MTGACISVPVSWLRLEQLALGQEDAAAREHCEACAVCRGCLDEIRGDVVALPALVVPEKRPRRWVWLALPALAAAAVMVFVVWPRPEDRVSIKGVGDVTVDVVRERDGAITEGARTFGPADRWKVVVTCPPAAGAWFDVEVGLDHPLHVAHVACGNRVYLPGAFYLTGTAPNRICVRVDPYAPPAPNAPAACVTVRPE